MTGPTDSGGRTLLEERYGRRPRRTSRRMYWILAAGGLTLGAVAAYVGYTNLGTAPIESQQVSFETLPDNAMRLTFEVTRDDPDRPAVCIVRTRVRDGGEGGRKEVLVPPGAESTRVTTVIQSNDEPLTADVFGCSYQVPVYLSTPPAAIRVN